MSIFCQRKLGKTLNVWIESLRIPNPLTIYLANLYSLFIALQDRLDRQQHDNEVERARLQGLISKLETQLTDQARTMEEVRYSISILFLN